MRRGTAVGHHIPLTQDPKFSASGVQPRVAVGNWSEGQARVREALTHTRFARTRWSAHGHGEREWRGWKTSPTASDMRDAMGTPRTRSAHAALNGLWGEVSGTATWTTSPLARASRVAVARRVLTKPAFRSPAGPSPPTIWTPTTGGWREEELDQDCRGRLLLVTH